VITIFTDASVCSTTRCAGWAAWIKDDGDALVRGGQLKSKMPNPPSDHAELFAIANALAIAAQRGYFVDDKAVMVQSDSMNALMLLVTECNAVDKAAEGGLVCTAFKRKNGKRGKWWRDTYNEPLKMIRDLIAKHDFRIRVRHVKGHQAAGSGGRAYVNNMIDEVAKANMRAARGEHYRQKESQNDQRECDRC
jgi:ribonuclease HI